MAVLGRTAPGRSAMLLLAFVLSAIVAGIVWGFSRLDGPMMELVGTTSANVILLAIIASVVFPRPGGPLSRTWSGVRPRSRAAWSTSWSCSRTRS